MTTKNKLKKRQCKKMCAESYKRIKDLLEAGVSVDTIIFTTGFKRTSIAQVKSTHSFDDYMDKYVLKKRLERKERRMEIEKLDDIIHRATAAPEYESYEVYDRGAIWFILLAIVLCSFVLVCFWAVITLLLQG